MSNPSSSQSLPSDKIFALFVEQSADGLLVIDAQGIVRFANPAAIALFAGKTAALIGHHLGVPAILAAAGHEGLGLTRAGLSADVALLFAVGLITSGLVGYLTVKYFLRYVSTRGLDVFAFYRFALAAAVVVWVFARLEP